MKTSDKGITLIKHFEGLHDGDLNEIGLQPKLCPAGVWTVGYGRALKDNKGRFVRGDVSVEKLTQMFPQFMCITEKQAEEYLIEDLRRFEWVVNNKVYTDLQQYEFDALVSHTYNTGGSSTLFSLVNKRDSKRIEKWMKTTYITANGVYLRGLFNRRVAEWVLFSENRLTL